MGVKSSSPAWSPDGNQLAIDRNDDLYLITRNGTGLFNVTEDGAGSDSPSWASDGVTLAFSRPAPGGSAIFWIQMDGMGLRRLTEGFTPDWRPVP